MLRKIFGPKRDVVTGEWKNYIMLNNRNTSHDNVHVIKSRRIKWAGHVERMGKGETFTGFLWENLRKETTWKTKA
jgi:hypothetical protein